MNIIDYKTYITETRASYIDYLSKNKSGKVTDDPTKITKIEAEISPKKGKEEYNVLSDFAVQLKTLAELKDKTEKTKEEVRQYMDELFNEEDKLYTRVLNIKELTVSLSKDTVRKNINYAAFIEELKTIHSNIAEDIDLLLEKFTSITKIESQIKATLKESLISDCCNDFIKTLRTSIRSLTSYLRTRYRTYDKFIAKWSK